MDEVLHFLDTGEMPERVRPILDEEVLDAAARWVATIPNAREIFDRAIADVDAEHERRHAGTGS